MAAPPRRNSASRRRPTAVWANQPTYGKAFKKPARDRKGQENTNAGNYKAPRRAAGRQGRASSIEQFFLMFRCEF